MKKWILRSDIYTNRLVNITFNDPLLSNLFEPMGFLYENVGAQMKNCGQLKYREVVFGQCLVVRSHSICITGLN